MGYLLLYRAFSSGIARRVSTALLLVLAGSTLLAQAVPCPGTRPSIHQIDGCQTGDWSMPEQAHDFYPIAPPVTTPVTTQIITVHELRHVVPKRALKEKQKADDAGSHNRRQEAIDHLNAAIQLDPEYVGARNDLAVWLMRGNDLEPAISQLEEAIKVDPHYPLLFSNLTVGYIVTGKLADAERTARVTMDLDRAGRLPRLLLGLALVSEHKYTEEVLRCLGPTLNEYPLAHLLVARVYIAQHNLTQAKSEIQTYLAGPVTAQTPVATQWLDYIEDNQRLEAAKTSPQ